MSSGQCTHAWSALSYLTVTHTCTLQKLYASSNNLGINSSDQRCCSMATSIGALCVPWQRRLHSTCTAANGTSLQRYNSHRSADSGVDCVGQN